MGMNTIDIDTGGTFTDGVFRFGGRVVTVKVDTTPDDPVKCFIACIEEGARLLDTDGPGLLASMDVVRYATTSATNAIVQMKGPKIGLLVSEGAESHLYDVGGAAENAGQAATWGFLDKTLVAGIRDDAADRDGSASPYSRGRAAGSGH